MLFKKTNMWDFFLVWAAGRDAWICILTRFLCVAMKLKLCLYQPENIFLYKIPHIQS